MAALNQCSAFIARGQGRSAEAGSITCVGEHCRPGFFTTEDTESTEDSVRWRFTMPPCSARNSLRS